MKKTTSLLANRFTTGMCEQFTVNYKLCVLSLPCGFNLLTTTQRIEAHITKCVTNDINIDQIHPVNLPLLQQFFNNTILDELLNDISYNNPIEVLLHEFRISEKNAQDILNRSHKLEKDMDTFVKRTKNNQIVNIL